MQHSHCNIFRVGGNGYTELVIFRIYYLIIYNGNTLSHVQNNNFIFIQV